MYTVHDWAEVRRLHEREHLSKKHIAERLGMSRTTVHRLLELSEPPRYERARRPSLLDPHMDSIKEMLTEDSAVPATVMLEHLRRESYRGGVSILKRSARRASPALRTRPRPVPAHDLHPGRDLPARLVGCVDALPDPGRTRTCAPGVRARGRLALLIGACGGLHPLKDRRRCHRRASGRALPPRRTAALAGGGP